MPPGWNSVPRGQGWSLKSPAGLAGQMPARAGGQGLSDRYDWLEVGAPLREFPVPKLILSWSSGFQLKPAFYSIFSNWKEEEKKAQPPAPRKSSVPKKAH